MKHSGVRFFCIFLFLMGIICVGASEPYLSVELSEDLSFHDFNLMKFSDNGTASHPDEYPEIRDKAVRVLLEEARWIFSGMIYGFQYRYVPGSGELQVEDEFSLIPAAQIEKGDPSLRVENISDDYRTLTVQFSYWLSPSQSRRVEQFHMSRFRAAGGKGSEPVTTPEAGRVAMELGVKEAIREDLRQQFYNRPREVSGLLCFSHSPRLILGSGSYNSFVRILYRVDQMKDYPRR